MALTNSSGTLAEKYFYDAWGNRKNPANRTQNDLRTTWIIDRGYTGHEHLDNAGLINMNGRLYDPQLGRMLNADPFTSEGTQGMNRYSYVLNNPLKYTEPSGYCAASTSYPGEETVVYYQAPARHDFSAAYARIDQMAGIVRDENGMYLYNSKTDIVTFTGDGALDFAMLYLKKGVYVEPIIKTEHWESGDVTSIIGDPSGQGVYDWGRAGTAIGAADVAYDVLENAVANKYWWMDAKGNYNSTKILSKGANGKFIQGVQGYRNGYNSALNAASKFNVAGNIVGGLGLGVTGLQYYNNQITGLEASVDAVFGVISFMGPIGAGIGATYFIGKLGYEYFSGNTVFEKPQ